MEAGSVLTPQQYRCRHCGYVLRASGGGRHRVSFEPEDRVCCPMRRAKS
jgi:ribosomal protein S27E